MKKYSLGIDIALLGVLLAAIAAPSFAVSLPFTGTAGAYPIIDQNTGNAQARADVQTSYNGLLATSCTTDMTRVDMNNQRLFPGVYCFSTGTILNGQVLLDAQNDPNAVFVFKMNNRFDVWQNATVVLLGGARPENIFWQVGGTVTIGANARFVGTVVAMNSITMGGGAASSVFDDKGTVNGRLWSVAGTVSVPPRAVVGLFQSTPLPYSYVPPTYVVPPTPTVAYLTVSSNDNNAFALFVNGTRVSGAERYSFAPGTYTVTEVNLSGTDYGTPVWSSACSQNGLSGTVTLNAGDDKTCIVTNTVSYAPQYQYQQPTYQYQQPVYQQPTYQYQQSPCQVQGSVCGACQQTTCVTCQPACNTACQPAQPVQPVTYVTEYVAPQPGLPNTGFGGSYLPILNMIGVLILTAFVWQETRYGRVSV